MGTFSTSLREMATSLTKELGNSCTLTQVSQGAYDPITGETSKTLVVFNSYCGPLKLYSRSFGDSGLNTNLDGFSSESVIVPWFGHVISKDWLFDDNNIIKLETLTAQDAIIAFVIDVGNK